jgi:hypothetical protein
MEFYNHIHCEYTGVKEFLTKKPSLAKPSLAKWVGVIQVLVRIGKFY